jgi:hypothetical protein
MKIAALGLTALEIDLACITTLKKLNQEGHEVHIIVASDRDSIDWTAEEAKSFFEKFNLSNIVIMDKRDYSVVTQENANALNAHIKKINPDLAFMPSWKSLNARRKILARTALIACRGIGSIMMYELDKNPAFNPTVSFAISASEPAAKLSSTESGSSSLSLTVQTGQPNTDTISESFECHRVSLVSDNWL